VPDDSPRPELIGHRGTPREYVENTLPAFARAIELGAQALELDVHATRDGGVVVHHDPTLPDGRPIADLWLDQVRHVILADGSPVPILEEVIDLAAQRVRLYVEVKALAATAPVAKLLRPYGGRHAVHSFDHRVAKRVHGLAHDLPTGILLSSYVLEPEALLRSAGARDFWQQREHVDAELVRRVHEAGGRVIAWTVNTAAEASALAALGVDGICTDVIPVVREALARG
jgi:glycerophosphoryl diester phosphodiesterase